MTLFGVIDSIVKSFTINVIGNVVDDSTGLRLSEIGNTDTLLYSLFTNSVWIPVVLLFVPFFVLCFNVGFSLMSQSSSGSDHNNLKKELNRRKQLSVQYEKMNLKGNFIFKERKAYSLIYQPISIHRSIQSSNIEPINRNTLTF